MEAWERKEGRGGKGGGRGGGDREAGPVGGGLYRRVLEVTPKTPGPVASAD